MKTREFETLINKLKMEIRDTGDRHAFFVHEGKKVVKTKISHGRCELPDYWYRKQLYVNERQLAGLIGCTLSRSDYVEILKEKGRL
jgi:hypothetical protein